MPSTILTFMYRKDTKREWYFRQYTSQNFRSHFNDKHTQFHKAISLASSLK